MSPPIILVLILSVFFGGLTSLFMLVSISTDYWENVKYDTEKLREHPNLVKNSSVFNEEEEFFKVVLVGGTIGNKTTYLLRNAYGGVWKICDRMSDSFRQSNTFTDARKEISMMDTKTIVYNRCFNYITDYSKLSRSTVEESLLFRMQNSAASCCIVGILSLITAIITGSFGVWQRQLSACMITGVMYSVAGVFQCFALIIMMTKVSYQEDKCYRLESNEMDLDLCQARTVTTGWSVTLAWVSFSMSIIALGFWLLLARCFRLENAKSML